MSDGAPHRFSLDATLKQNPRSTIEPSRKSPDERIRRALERLSHDSRTGRAIEVEQLLGEGGMGAVHLATQHSMARKVAIKRLRSEHKDSSLGTMKLLQEAWVTGALEHPNVVPVYDIMLDEEERPFIVLKRVNGVTWSDLIGDPERVRTKFGVREPLEWHLGILKQVCNAVKFAHAQGIVHRDLKPENVMIGAFGEVYLLDWGIAVSLEDDRDGRFPSAKDAKEPAGTPGYMAPEMLGGPRPEISERTDVYLLGATLFEIVACRPPHTGETVAALLAAVAQSTPTFPDDFPRELEKICRKAMQPAASDRYADVEEFRIAIEEFLQQKASRFLAEEALRSLDELTAALGASDARKPDGRIRVYQLFGQCRFGFQHALKECPQNETAVDGLEEALKKMVTYELDCDNASDARLLHSEMRSPPQELTSKVEQALAAQRTRTQRMGELEQLERELDPTIGARTRLLFGTLFGFIWSGTPIIGHFYEPQVRSHVATILVPLCLLLEVVLFFLWARDTFTRTIFNRRVAGTTILTFIAQLFLAVVSFGLDVDPITAQILPFAIWFCSCSIMALFMDARLTGVSVVYALAGFLAVGWPDLRFIFISAAQIVFTVVFGIVWNASLVRPRAIVKSS